MFSCPCKCMDYRLDIVHAAITDLDCVSVENLV